MEQVIVDLTVRMEQPPLDSSRQERLAEWISLLQQEIALRSAARENRIRSVREAAGTTSAKAAAPQPSLLWVWLLLWSACSVWIVLGGTVLLRWW